MGEVGKQAKWCNILQFNCLPIVITTTTTIKPTQCRVETGAIGARWVVIGEVNNNSNKNKSKKMETTREKKAAQNSKTGHDGHFLVNFC